MSKSSFSEYVGITRISADILERCLENRHVSRRFLTELSKFERDNVAEAYQHFCDFGKLPARKANDLKNIKRSVEKAFKELHEQVKNRTSTGEEIGLLDLLTESHGLIDTVLKILGTYEYDSNSACRIVP